MAMTKTEITIKKSSQHFMQYVWPIIRDYIGGGEIIPAEGVTEYEFAKELDTTAGIDAWQIFHNKIGMKCIRPIASRVQWERDAWADYPFNTFTIRCELSSRNFTEYHKRLYAIKHKTDGILYPAITIHSYLGKDGPPVYSIASIKTDDLFDAIKEHPCKPIPVLGGNKMFKLLWEDLKLWGYNVNIYINPQKRKYLDCDL